MTTRLGIWHDSEAMGGEPATPGGRATTAGVTLEWSARTDVGRERAVNEDSMLAGPPVFIVADGMGGHRAGDVASALVVDSFSGIADGELRSVEEIVELLDQANTSIITQGSSSAAREGMGTTTVGLLLVDSGDRPSWLIVNVGDSRAYRFADGALEQLSTDHSYVQELVDAGQISVGSARTHPHRNVVTRALGAEEGLRPDLWIRPPRAGERFLLCTDGLSTEVADDEIRRVLAAGSSDEAATALVEAALDAGGHDNVTVLVVDVLRVDDGTPPEITEPRDLVEDEATVEHRTIDRRRSGGPRRGSLGRPEVPSEPDPIGLIDRVPGLDELVDRSAGEPGPAGDHDLAPNDDPAPGDDLGPGSDRAPGDDLGPGGDRAPDDDAVPGDDAARGDVPTSTGEADVDGGVELVEDDRTVIDGSAEDASGVDVVAEDDRPSALGSGRAARGAAPDGPAKRDRPKSRTNRKRSTERGE